MSEHAHAPTADREAAPSRKSPPAKSTSRLMLQRKCACGAGAGAGGECDTCAGAAPFLQRHSASPNAGHEHGAWPSSVNDAISRTGQPLDADTQHFMEDRFGTDFGSVRVHDDTAAGASAREVDAQAYTVGQHIVFGDGHYQPHSESGRHLLAHELAHTVQQQGLQRSGVSNLADHGPDYRRLEAEADHAADQVMRGPALTASALSSAGAVRLSRKPPKSPLAGKSEDHEVTARYRDLEVTTGHKVTPEKSLTAKVKGKDKEFASFDVDHLELHASKGPVLEEWRSKAKAGALRAIVTMQGAKAQEAGLWQMRVRSEELRERWVDKRGWKRSEALDDAWKGAYKTAAGKVANDGDVFPYVDGVSCEMDHTIELQVGGDNTQENIQILDRADNGMSGSLIKQQVFGLAQSIATKMEEAQEDLPAQIRLVFKDANLKGSANCGPCCKTAQKLGPPKTKEGMADKSSQILIDYPVTAGGRTVSLRVSEKSKSAPIFESEETSNKAAAELLPGLLLMTLNRTGKKGKDTIQAMLDNRDRTRLPISMPAKGTGVLLNVEESGALKLADVKKDAGIAFTYDYLSPGRFTSLQAVAGGVAGEGYITPSKVPFLKRIDVAFAPDYFRLRAPLDKDKLQPPFPGVKITETSLAIDLAPKLKPVGSIAFEFGGAKKLATSKVEVSADENGLALDGTLLVFLPGVEEAKGTISYRGGIWSGGVHVEAGQMKGLPFVKGGAVDVFVKGGRLDAGGKVNLELPGKNEATLELQYAQSKWLFKGSGRIRTKSPYLKPIDASILYDGDLLLAKGKAGFAFSGLDGVVDATYEHRVGRDKVYGKGDIKIDKGRAQGNIVVELHPNETITGKGKLSYRIKEDMVATAGITIDDKQKITFDGELTFPDIKLFPRFPAKEEPHTIFSASGTIPIPGASIGPIGLKVKLFGSLGYYYYVGPGVLTGIRAAVKFSPFEPDPDFAFSLKAKASIPAAGGITGTVGATLSLDALIAEVGGTISIPAKAGLEGKAEFEGEIAYSKDRFSIDASAYVGGGVVLSAALNATLFAEAGVWKFKVRTEKTWTLAEGRFDTGLKLGVRMPLHYDSVDGFRMPKLSDVKPEPAELNLDAKKMLGKLFGDTTPKEREV